MESFAVELGIPFAQRLEASHVIEQSQVIIFVLNCFLLNFIFLEGLGGCCICRRTEWYYCDFNCVQEFRFFKWHSLIPFFKRRLFCRFIRCARCHWSSSAALLSSYSRWRVSFFPFIQLSRKGIYFSNSLWSIIMSSGRVAVKLLNTIVTLFPPYRFCFLWHNLSIMILYYVFNYFLTAN